MNTKLANVFLPQSDQMRKDWVVQTLARLKKGLTILDAGAGQCQYKAYCTHLNYTAQDFASYDGVGDTTGIQTGTRDRSCIDITSDITKIPVKSASFDSILCVEVFEHLPHPELALKEFARILRPGGQLILTAPFSSLTHYSPFYYFSGFSRNWFTEVLPQHGFSIQNLYSYGNYFDALALELARIPLVLIRTKTILSLVALLFLPFIVPAYLYVRALGFLVPRSQSLQCFGYCVLASKKR